MFKWFFQKGVRQGIFWSFIAYLQCALQDVFIRQLKEIGTSLHMSEIMFFRFLFSLMSIFGAMLIFGKLHLMKTKIHGLHLARGLLGSAMLTLAAMGVMEMTLVENSAILFAQAFVTIIIAVLWLKEKVNSRIFVALLFGIVGVLSIAFASGVDGISCKFNYKVFIPLSAAILAAISSILIKKMTLLHENKCTMLFYFALYTTVISFIPALLHWQTPNLHELLYLLMYGVGANLVQFFIFLAYEATEASKIAHMQYTEIPFSLMFGWMFFGEKPSQMVIVGILFIVLGVVVSSKKDKCGCC